MSGYLPRVSKPRPGTASIMFLHGTEDPVSPPEWAQTARVELLSAGMREVDMHLYEGLGHEISVEEIIAARTWLKRFFARQEPGKGGGLREEEARRRP